MDRQQRIRQAPTLRKGKSVAEVRQDKHGRDFTVRVRDFDSLNQAKKANGINSVALQRHEQFPPREIELPVIEEAAEAAALL